MKKIKFLVLSLSSMLLISSCNGANNKNQYSETNVLCVMSGYYGDSPYQNDLYYELIENNEKNQYNVNLTLYELGNEKDIYEEKFKNEINSKSYDYIVVLGDDLSLYTEGVIKTYQGYKFIYFDNESEEKYANTTSFNFSPEEFGALAAIEIKKKQSDNVAILYKYQNHFNNRKLYGMLNNLNENELKIAPFNIEENYNEAKVLDYIAKAKNDFNADLFFEDSKSNYDVIKENISSEKLISSTYTNSEVDENTVYKNYNKLFDTLLKNIAENNLNFDKNYEFGIEEGYLSSSNYKGQEINNNKLINNEYDEFNGLKERYFLDVSSNYDTKNSVYGKYHEALPHCSDMLDWKNAPRPGADNAMKPADWKCLGIWSTIYAQDGMRRVSNTGIEFKNMKIYGYSSRRGWVFLDHANPVGNFYEENFKDDYNKSFPNKVINDKDEKKTRIKLDEETYGFNYHPFGTQIDLESLDMVDIEYVYSTMDIRLITWNPEMPSDINDAKYVANIGGDWWIYKGATWKPDWSANRDISVGQFRTITQEWKTLEMCSVPLDKIDNILGNKEFLK